ncbi:hypothetical protein Smp_166850 [Schistosoma mansoni]|uniref:hypothetical protein n=1 Tax=Schistosoma mansoni TaxID=6183 RepID=UPI0001A623C5|nr:hypothetical protein Smp_166850 [Schistosoma mansoni]|eukprot:XP_018645441.1 hypothetical protein Smp_166850 [Schistosoma mansoni]
MNMLNENYTTSLNSQNASEHLMAAVYVVLKTGKILIIDNHGRKKCEVTEECFTVKVESERILLMKKPFESMLYACLTICKDVFYFRLIEPNSKVACTK